MSVEQHRLLLLRHGETEWSLSGRHTGRTELGLTETGREQAKLAADALDVLSLDNPLVVSSPRQRALVTAELAGLTVDDVSPLLAEWDYGDYEGLTTPEIRQTVPDWLVWTYGCPGGESTQQANEKYAPNIRTGGKTIEQKIEEEPSQKTTDCIYRQSA